MAQDWAKAFYKSKAWQRCREGYIKSVYGLCEHCQRPGYIVHHKIRLTPKNITDAEVSLNWQHLEYLCTECHNKEHGEAEVIRAGLKFDINGNIIKG